MKVIFNNNNESLIKKFLLFLEDNKSKYLIVSSDYEHYKWIFKYDHVDTMAGPGCILFYEIMYPLHLYPDKSKLCKTNFMQVNECDYIRLANEDEIKLITDILK